MPAPQVATFLTTIDICGYFVVLEQHAFTPRRARHHALGEPTGHGFMRQRASQRSVWRNYWVFFCRFGRLYCGGGHLTCPAIKPEGDFMSPPLQHNTHNALLFITIIPSPLLLHGVENPVNPGYRKQVLRLARSLPALHIETAVQPVSRGILRLTLRVSSDFSWQVGDDAQGDTSRQQQYR